MLKQILIRIQILSQIQTLSQIQFLKLMLKVVKNRLTQNDTLVSSRKEPAERKSTGEMALGSSMSPWLQPIPAPPQHFPIEAAA